MEAPFILQTEGLTKRFAKVVANDAISLSVRRGEILSIIGENGAGKSTFCKMLTGLYQPDAGAILLAGGPVRFQNTAQSIAAGVSMVYQERNLVGMLTGAQNICLGTEPLEKALIDEKQIAAEARRLKEQMGLSVPLDVPVHKLGAGEQQMVEILRAVYRRPRLLILDEPTASLGKGEIEPFFAFIRRIREAMDMSVIFISHKIEEVFAISDTIAIFTDGRLVLTSAAAHISREACIRAMLRSAKLKPIGAPVRDVRGRTPILEVEALRYDGAEHHLGLEVRPGEIVGCYGLVGSGRTECAEALYGLRRIEGGSYRFAGRKIAQCSPEQMIARGMILTPEIRQNAIFKTFSLQDNICNLFLRQRFASPRLGLLHMGQAKSFARGVLEKNKVKYSDVNQPIVELSGGNIQKVVLGRSVEIEGIRLLMIDEPTTGMDLGAKNEIYQMLLRLAEEKELGILFISSELEELLAICGRLYVFAGGQVAAHFERAQFDKERILDTAVRGGAYA